MSRKTDLWVLRSFLARNLCESVANSFSFKIKSSSGSQSSALSYSFSCSKTTAIISPAAIRISTLFASRRQITSLRALNMRSIQSCERIRNYNCILNKILTSKHGIQEKENTKIWRVVSLHKIFFRKGSQVFFKKLKKWNPLRDLLSEQSLISRLLNMIRMRVGDQSLALVCWDVKQKIINLTLLYIWSSSFKMTSNF